MKSKMIPNDAKAQLILAQRIRLHSQMRQERDAQSHFRFLPSSTAARLTNTTILWPENPVQYLVFLTLLTLDQTQEREENTLMEVGSLCCIAAGCNPHYLHPPDIAWCNLFSVELLSELHCSALHCTVALSHQPPDPRIFFLCLLNLSQSSTAISLYAWGATHPSTICYDHSFIPFPAFFSTLLFKRRVLV